VNRAPKTGPPARRTIDHPGPGRATLPAAIRDALVAYARAEYPNEACGLIAGTAPAAEGGTATRWHPTRNLAASPLRYEIHPDDLLRASLAIDDADEVTWGIVHSHVRSAARPSPTDVGLAGQWPDVLHVLVSLAADQRGFVPRPAAGAAQPAGAPSAADAAPGVLAVRAWRIVDGAAFEVALDVEAEAARGAAAEGG
jgi:proteasome lid subunit RPN8/RPN11